jgi:hypothetical protein
MNALSLTGALAGVLYGYAAERGDFCVATALERGLRGRDPTRLRALQIAIAVQMLVVPLLFLVGLANPGLPAFFPLGALLGGLLFGASLRWAGGCSASLFHRAGAGQLGALAGLSGLALGASLFELGPLDGLRALVQAQAPALGRWDLTDRLGIPLSLVSPLCGALLLGAAWQGRGPAAGRKAWRTLGLTIGGIASLGWVLAALCARDYGLSELPGLFGLLRLGVQGVPPRGAFDILFVLALPLGGFLASRRAGEVGWSRPAAPRVLLQRLLGGVGLGAGASLAAGGSLGHVLTGVPLLASGSLCASAALVLGAWLGARWR